MTGPGSNDHVETAGLPVESAEPPVESAELPVESAELLVEPVETRAGAGSGVAALLSTVQSAGAVIVKVNEAFRSGWSKTAKTRLASATANSV